MRRLIEAEVLKLRTTRTFFGLLIATLGLISLVVVLTLALSSNLGGEADVRSLLSSAGASGLLVLVLGVVASAGEYRHGTIASTFLIAPDRLRVLLAQASACAIGGVAIGLAAAALTAAVALPWLAAKDVALGLSSGEVLGLFCGGVLYSGLAGALGAGVGALVRNQVAAIVIVLMLLFVVDPALTALVDGYAKFSLSGLAVTITGGPVEDLDEDTAELLPFWLATLIWTGYSLTLVAAATILARRRDIQ